MFITKFRSTGKAYVQSEHDLFWDEIVCMLLRHHSVKSKTDVGMFNLAEFKKLGDPTVELGRKYKGKVVNGKWQRLENNEYDEIPGTVRRCKANLISITGIVLDVDKQLTLEQAITQLDGLEYVLYTTFNHSLETNKFRVIIPFARALLAEDILHRQESIKMTFPGVDGCSFTVSQSFYFHSGANDPIAYHNKGIILDPYDDFACIIPPPPVVFAAPEFTDERKLAYKERVMKELLTCSNVRYADGLLLASICKSANMDYNEFDVICSNICGSDSHLTDRAIRIMLWKDCKLDRVTTVTREKFIKTNNGVIN